MCRHHPQQDFKIYLSHFFTCYSHILWQYELLILGAIYDVNILKTYNRLKTFYLYISFKFIMVTHRCVTPWGGGACLPFGQMWYQPLWHDPNTPTCKAKVAIRKISKFENKKLAFELRSIIFFLHSIQKNVRLTHAQLLCYNFN